MYRFVRRPSEQRPSEQFESWSNTRISVKNIFERFSDLPKLSLCFKQYVHTNYVILLWTCYHFAHTHARTHARTHAHTHTHTHTHTHIDLSGTPLFSCVVQCLSLKWDYVQTSFVLNKKSQSDERKNYFGTVPDCVFVWTWWACSLYFKFQGHRSNFNPHLWVRANETWYLKGQL